MSMLSRREALTFGAATVGSAALAPLALGAPRSRRPADEPARRDPPQWLPLKVGSVECVVAGDGASKLAPIHPLLAPEATKEELDRVLDRAFHPRDAAMLAFNAIVLRLAGATILVDTGTGAPAGAPVGHLEANLRAAGVAPESIDAILITHAHRDHVGGLLRDDGSLRYPNARILIGRREHDFWTSAAPDLSTSRLSEGDRKGMIATAQERIAAVKDRLDLVDSGATLHSAVQLLDTSGHTPGHLSLLVDGGGEQLCVLADVAHNHVVMFANPSWTIAFDADPAAAAATRRRVFDRLATDRTKVLGYHLPWPGLGHIRKEGDGYEWVMAPTEA